MGTSIRLILIEDSEDDALLVVRHLRREGFEPVHERVDTLPALLKTLNQGEWDLILCDFNLPEFDAHSALRTVRDAGLHLPFIVLSGTVSEGELVGLMRAGAHDVVLKSDLARLVPAISRELSEAETRRARARAEAALHDAIESISDGFALYDADDKLVMCNNVYKEVYSASTDLFVLGARFEDIIREGARRGEYPAAAGRVEDWVRERMALHRSCDHPFEQQIGHDRWLLVNEHRTSGGGIASVRTDITELKRTERRLRERERQLDLITNNLPVLIAQLDTDQRYMFINETGTSWYARPAAEIIGRSVDEILGDGLGAKLRFHFDGISKEKSVTFDDRISYPDGKTRDIERTYVPFVAEDGSIQSVIAMSIDITARKQAEDELRLRQRAIEASGDGIVISDMQQPDQPVIYVNSAFEQITGYTAEETLGRNLRFLRYEDQEHPAHDEIRAAIREHRATAVVMRNCRKDGSIFWNELSIAPVRNEGGDVTHFVGILHDITDRKATEAQLQQSQKMEAVGQLTGGVAHDFNNLLAVILGNLQLVGDAVAQDAKLRQRIETAEKAVQRGVELTSRLLAFSRRQVLEPKVVDFQEMVPEIGDLLRRTLGEDIEVKMQIAEGLWPIRVDPGPLQTALLNLAINARDAMAEGGVLMIEAENTTVDADHVARDPLVSLGDYVRLTVRDTGAGMAPEILDQVFEPFFTTKEVGKGTGLGLSMVYGFVKQSNGHIRVESIEGEGTSLDIHLPRTSDKKDLAGAEITVESSIPTGSETILVVEDNEAVRETAMALLEALDYNVFAVDNGAAAAAMLEERGDIDLLFSDVVMPGGMSGIELAQRALETRPGLKVLCTSGYSESANARENLGRQGIGWIEKPYRQEDLARKIRDLFDAPSV